eukprot:12878243-Heterocapsa_arctica.AAC.1
MHAHTCEYDNNKESARLFRRSSIPLLQPLPEIICPFCQDKFKELDKYYQHVQNFQCLRGQHTPSLPCRTDSPRPIARSSTTSTSDTSSSSSSDTTQDTSSVSSAITQ